MDNFETMHEQKHEIENRQNHINRDEVFEAVCKACPIEDKKCPFRIDNCYCDAALQVVGNIAALNPSSPGPELSAAYLRSLFHNIEDRFGEYCRGVLLHLKPVEFYGSTDWDNFKAEYLKSSGELRTCEWVLSDKDGKCGAYASQERDGKHYCEYHAGRIDAVEQLPDERPEIVCLCGSTRFTDLMLMISWECARKGVIALGWSVRPIAEGEPTHHLAEKEGMAEQFDELHKRKIDLADSVMVLNVGGYIGESTRSEIEYAKQHKKPIMYLEPVES